KEVPISEGSSVTTTERYKESYKNVSQDIRDQLNAEDKAVEIILTGIDNDIYSISQELKTVSYHKLYDILKQYQNEVNEIRAERIARTSNPLALVAQQQPEEAGIQFNAEQADWRDDTDDELEDQELEAHYMYMAQLQEVSPDVADSGPVFDTEPVQKVSNNDHYNMFTIESKHPEQSESIHNTYPIEQDEYNVIIDSLDMSYDREQIDQNDDDDVDLANEREIEDFKNKNKCLESSNNRFKEANNKLSETNKLLCDDFKKSQAELKRRNSVEYASKVEIDCAKVRGDLISYKMES
nr:hypothetical protein [Tanacetum cinerariifolium]